MKTGASAVESAGGRHGAIARGSWPAVIIVGGWYAFALAVLYPITDGPVADSWLYAAAVRRFLRTGEIRFAGYSQAMPVAQVLYGGLWGRVCGAGSASLTLSMVPVAILTAVMFHALARRCGAVRWQAIAATGLLVCNPCFTFLSFSFMTEIPFVAFLIGSFLAFALARGPRKSIWLWIAAAAAVGGFLIRPFAGLAIAGCAGAIVVDGLGMRRMRKPVLPPAWKP
ncbi:MAG TPA: glycosyltransferase family 39 protein, partial [Candidatus Binataceae bacterium]|nr:glycosyltransferase family 39 protein [Candidatus Binataceae bacterium]